MEDQEIEDADPAPQSPQGARAAVYDTTKAWWQFRPREVRNADELTSSSTTLPPSLFAIVPPAPSWLNDNNAVSRGYFDDACDGQVEVRLQRDGRPPLTADGARSAPGRRRWCPIRSSCARSPTISTRRSTGPRSTADEPPEVTRARAEDIVRRAFETVRFMNVAVMNGNDFKGRSALDVDFDARGGSRRHRARDPPGDPARERRHARDPRPAPAGLCGAARRGGAVVPARCCASPTRSRTSPTPAAARCRR